MPLDKPWITLSDSGSSDYMAMPDVFNIKRVLSQPKYAYKPKAQEKYLGLELYVLKH